MNWCFSRTKRFLFFFVDTSVCGISCLFVHNVPPSSCYEPSWDSTAVEGKIDGYVRKTRRLRMYSHCVIDGWFEVLSQLQCKRSRTAGTGEAWSLPVYAGWAFTMVVDGLTTPRTLLIQSLYPFYPFESGQQDFFVAYQTGYILMRISNRVFATLPGVYRVEIIAYINMLCPYI